MIGDRCDSSSGKTVQDMQYTAGTLEEATTVVID